MSSDVYTYMGPMVLIDVSTTHEYTDIIIACANEDCTQHLKSTKDNFCRVCGKEIMEVHLSKDKHLTWEDFIYSASTYNRDYGDEELREADAVSDPKHIVMVSNMGSYQVDIEPDFFMLYDDITKLKSKYMRKFNSRYSGMLTDIRKFFGEGNVTVTFGIASYWW